MQEIITGLPMDFEAIIDGNINSIKLYDLGDLPITYLKDIGHILIRERVKELAELDPGRDTAMLVTSDMGRAIAYWCQKQDVSEAKKAILFETCFQATVKVLKDLGATLASKVLKDLTGGVNIVGNLKDLDKLAPGLSTLLSAILLKSRPEPKVDKDVDPNLN